MYTFYAKTTDNIIFKSRRPFYLFFTGSGSGSGCGSLNKGLPAQDLTPAPINCVYRLQLSLKMLGSRLPNTGRNSL